MVLFSGIAAGGCQTTGRTNAMPYGVALLFGFCEKPPAPKIELLTHNDGLGGEICADGLNRNNMLMFGWRTGIPDSQALILIHCTYYIMAYGYSLWIDGAVCNLTIS